MKHKYLYGAGVVVMLVMAACSKDFLEKPPIGTLSPEIVASEAGVQGLLIGAYSLLDGNGSTGDGNYGSAASNWGYGGVASDDAYKGSDPSDVADFAPFEQFVTLTPTNGAVPQKWNLGYNGAQRCNDVLNTLAISTGISESTKTGIIAQARFLRAFYHMELKKVFNNIIYADENVNPTNTKVTNTADVWPKIEADLKFAVDNLPETWSEVGRVNKSAAKAFLAKAYMFQKKFAAAYPILQDVIATGKTSNNVKYGLNPQYYSNFNPAQKNSRESVFAVQTSVQDGSSVDWGGAPNGNYGDILNFPYNGGPGACCGFYNPSQDLANAHKTDANGLPLLDESYATGLRVGDSTNTYTGTLDPRLDLTIGRKGVPYLDWGLHPGADWIRNVPNDGLFSPKKNVYANSQKGTFTDVGSAYWGPTELVANNVNLIRFSDVLLWAAECAVTAGDIPTAMAYVNTVRARAADPSGWVYRNSDYNAATAQYSTQTTPAANYKIGLYTPATFTTANAMKAVMFERRLELAMEGHRFFDLVRWGIAAPTINTYIAREKAQRPLKQNASFTAGKNEYFPIPQGTLDKLNSDGTKRITQNPGY
ncbi:RagB/SusD family nutrient uptake outer membrane protein [Segetibacter sp.]|uniref:RagB/SusD family nutrient uptake outer membrane protein n=1 Tax=Segetibacter sp. TaxID=2231182 RepID=UPI00260C62A8|nr:RagB/SusD family nutrient uptake outer membrane protein [Segetibacter sp.]